LYCAVPAIGDGFYPHVDVTSFLHLLR
jgi:hypothetical protein